MTLFGRCGLCVSLRVRWCLSHVGPWLLQIQLELEVISPILLLINGDTEPRQSSKFDLTTLRRKSFLSDCVLPWTFLFACSFFVP